MNSTLTAEAPLQLVVGSKRDGVQGGSWRWKGEQLHYDQVAGQSNHGLYYACQDKVGRIGLFMYLKP